MDARHARIQTALGELLLVGVDDSLTGVYFPHHWHPPAAGSIGAEVDAGNDALFGEAATQLNDFLAGDRSAFKLPIAISGNDFEEDVWALLQQIPYGNTTTYGELATQLGDPTLARMVGQAVGHNPLSIVIACHRVVGKNGSLTGYAGGLERKRRLLELEQPQPADAGRLF